MLNFLLLEDDEFDIYLIKKVLTRAKIDHAIVVASDKASFNNAIQSGNFDVILADHSLPQFNATEALAILQEKGITAPFIIVTGTMSEEYAVNVMKSGASDYVLKDRLQRLPNAILSAIEKDRFRTEKDQYYNQLTTREELLKEAESLARYGSWAKNPHTGISYWSDEKYRILGYEPQSVEPNFENYLAKVHPEDRENVRRLYKMAFEELHVQEYSCRIIGDKGEIRHIQAEVFLEKDKDGKVKKLNGLIRDITADKEAEQRIKESEQKYHGLFEKSPIPLIVFERSTLRILDVNEAATEAYGYAREVFLTMFISDICADETRGSFDELRQSIEEGFTDKSVWRHRRRDGGIIYMEVSLNNILFGNKHAGLFLCNDVTEKRATEDILRHNEAQLIATQRISRIGSWEVDLRGGVGLVSDKIKWTDEMYRIFGLEPGSVQLTAAYFQSLIHADDRDMIEKALEDTLRRKKDLKVEFRIVLPDGSIRIVSEIGEVVYDAASGQAIKITGTAQDVTERRKAEDQLRTSEANLRSIFDNTETAYVLLDTELRILSVNKPARKFSETHFKLKVSEKSYALDYFPEDKQVMIRRSLKSALKGGNINFEISFPEPDNTAKWYYAHFHPVWTMDKEVIGVIMSLRDITERKLSELQEKKIAAELIQRNKDLEQFAYIISHNLRAPVANIRGISEALHDGDLTDQDKILFTEGLIASAKKLDNVIMDLNHILQVKHEVNENKERVQFSQIVNDIKFTLSGMSDADMFQITHDFSAVDEMTTLKSYVHSIFYNLISNSIKYRQPQLAPVIEISSARNGDRIELRFRDNGIGIDLEKKGEQIFGLYKRFHPQMAEGKGMGLYMVKTQVETLNGKISVQSKVNQGTEFRIEFLLGEDAN